MSGEVRIHIDEIFYGDEAAKQRLAVAIERAVRGKPKRRMGPLARIRAFLGGCRCR